jgi:hypothetical protein
MTPLKILVAAIYFGSFGYIVKKYDLDKRVIELVRGSYIELVKNTWLIIDDVRSEELANLDIQVRREELRAANGG